jgi:hypothetical protein
MIEIFSSTYLSISQEIKKRILIANKYFYGLKNQLKSHVLSWKIKIILYKTWVLSTSDEKALGVFERKVSRSIYDPVKDSNEWRIRYKYALYEETDLYKSGCIEIGLVMLFEWTSNDLRKEFLMPNQKAEEKEKGL